MGKLLDRGWTIDDMRRHPFYELRIAAAVMGRVDILKNPPTSDEEALHEMVKSNPDIAPVLNRYYEEKEKLYAGPVERVGSTREDEEP